MHGNLSVYSMHCVAYEYDIQLLVSLNPPPPPRIYVAMCKKNVYIYIYCLWMKLGINKHKDMLFVVMFVNILENVGFFLCS